MNDHVQVVDDERALPTTAPRSIGFLAVMLLGVCTGYIIMSVIPLWTEGVLRSTGGREAWALLCGSAELGGGALAALAYSRWGLTIAAGRSIRAAALIVVAANVASIAILASPHFFLPLFAGARIAAGAGAAILLATINARITRTRSAERLFIVGQFAFCIVAAITFQLLPSGMAAAQARGISTAVPIWLTTAGFALLMLALSSYADHDDRQRPRNRGQRHRLSGRDWLQLLMLTVFFSGFNSIYSYWERFGAHAGVSREFVAHMLGLGSLSALVGLALASLAVDRLGVRLPILVCLATLALSAWISSHGGVLAPPAGHLLFGTAMVADQTCVVVIVPLVLTLMAMQDRGGSVTAAAPSAINIGNVIGPTIAVFAGQTGYANIGWTAIAFYGFGLIVLLLVSRASTGPLVAREGLA